MQTLDCRAHEDGAIVRVQERITGIEDHFHTIQTYYGLAVLSGRIAGPDIKRFSKLLETIETAQSAMFEMVKDKPAWHPSTVERVDSLVDVNERLAIEKGAGIFRPDAYHSLVVERLTGNIQAYWHRAGQHELLGMIRHQPEVCELLRPRGIEVWTNDDTHVRLVNHERLVNHADIYAHVDHLGWQGGRRCRACCIPEIATSRELVAVDPAKRSGYTTHNGQHVLQPATIYAHERCIPTWKRWLAIVEQYKTQAEAEAADLAAGRTSQPVPEMPQLEEPPADETKHYSSKEQGR